MTVSPAVSPPPGNPRFPLFDSLRAIAVLSVIAFHVSALTGGLYNTGWGKYSAVLSNGVYVFFVISGFLLYRPFAASRLSGGPPPRWSRYLRRRALRIIPAYWFALTLLAIWPGIPGVFSQDWWIYYGFLQAFSADTLFIGINVAWSLTVEVCFYLLLPLWAAAMARLGSGTKRSLRPELALLLGLVAVQLTTEVLIARGEVSSVLHYNLPGGTGYFAIGMGLALASIALTESRPAAVRAVEAAPGLLWLGAAGCLIGLGLHQGTPVLVVEQVSSPVSIPPFAEVLRDQLVTLTLGFGLAGLLVLPAVFGDPDRGLVRGLLGSRPLSWIGVVSYGAYLYHYVIACLIVLPAAPAIFSADVGLDLGQELPGRLITPVCLLLTVAATLAVAALSYRFVELPFLRRKEPREPGETLPGERAGFG